jgi:hypothetical protein
VSDCHSFLNSSENWAERAAELGWDARALFGCHRNYPLNAMVVGLISGGLGMIGIGQGLRLLLLILGKA